MRLEDDVGPGAPAAGGGGQPDEAVAEVIVEAEPGPERSLLADIEALIADAKTYFDAEVSYQKSRAAFVGSSVKRTVGLAIAGVIVAFVAVMALAIGLIFALAPLVTAWGATAIVVGALAVAVLLLLGGAGRSWNGMMDAIKDDGDEA